MKLTIAVLFSFIVCFSIHISAQKFEGPLENVLKKKLNLSGQEFEKKCASKSAAVIKHIRESHATAIQMGTDLANDVLNRAKKLPKVDEKNWDAIVDDRCRKDVAIKVLSDISVDNVNLCLDDKDHLEGKKRKQFAGALLTGYCTAVKTLAKKKYGGRKN